MHSDRTPRKMVDDVSNGDSNHGLPSQDSLNGDSFLRKPILDSSDGDSFPRKPIQDSSSGDSFPREPFQGSSNGKTYFKKPTLYSLNSESYPREPVQDSLKSKICPNQDSSNSEIDSRKSTELSNCESYSGKSNHESSKCESCCKITVELSVSHKSPRIFRKRLYAVSSLRDWEYNYVDPNLDTTIVNNPISNVPNLTSVDDYNPDKTLVGLSLSNFNSDINIQANEYFPFTSTPKGKRSSDSVKSSLKDVSDEKSKFEDRENFDKSCSFAKETLSNADLRLEKIIKSCLKANIDRKIGDSEVNFWNALDSYISCYKSTLCKASLRLKSIKSCLKTTEDLDQNSSEIKQRLDNDFYTSEETLSNRADLRIGNIKPCLKTAAAFDQPSSKFKRFRKDEAFFIPEETEYQKSAEKALRHALDCLRNF